MANAGRLVRIYEGDVATGTLIAGARADSITINNEPIDITDKGDAGWRTFLDVPSVRSVDMSVSGLLDGSTLLDAALAGSASLSGTYTIDIDDIGEATGTFYFGNMEVSAPHDGAAEFSASIQSSGPITWTLDV